MQSIVKNAEEIILRRESDRLLAQVFALRVKDSMVINTPLNSSVNEVVCHGVPNPRQSLKTSDIVNIDITLEKNGFIADSSKMYVLEGASAQAKHLVKITYEALWQAAQGFGDS